MDPFELELARHEAELQDMQDAQREEDRFLLVVVAILSAGAGAALMLAAAALIGLLFVLGSPAW
jgi:hypothetical protein